MFSNDEEGAAGKMLRRPLSIDSKQSHGKKYKHTFKRLAWIHLRRSTAITEFRAPAALTVALLLLFGCSRAQLEPLPSHPSSGSAAYREDPYDLSAHVFAVSPTGGFAPHRDILQRLEGSSGTPCLADEQQNEDLRLRAQFTCVIAGALAHQSRWTAAGERLRAEDPFRLVFYFNGGLNSLGNTLETARDTYRAIEQEGMFPVYMAWDTGGPATYWEDVTRVRNGRYEDPPALDATSFARPFGDLLQGVGGTPSAWAYSFTQFRDTNYGRGSPEYGMKRDEGLLLGEKELVTAEKNLIFDKRYADDPTREPTWSYHVQNGARWARYGLAGPSRVLTMPIVVGAGEAMWRNMVRRTRTAVRAVREFPDGGAEEGGGPSGCMPMAPSMSASMLRTCYPQGSGGFARFFQWLESCASGKLIQAGADECPLPEGMRRRAQDSLSRTRIVMIGHSMGSIVVNELLQLFPKLPYEAIVYMGGAATILDTSRAVSPILKQNQGCTQFYNLMLHPMNEERESATGGFLVSGSLLVYVDEMFESPRTLGDRTVGQWRNMRVARHLFPDDVRKWMLFRVFDRDAGQYTNGNGTFRGRIPTMHGDFNDKGMPFWQRTFWNGGVERFQVPAVCGRIFEE